MREFTFKLFFMPLQSTPESSLVRNGARKNPFLGGRLSYFRNLIMAGLITASQFASAQNPNSISQSDKLDSNSHTTIQSSLDGTIVEPGRHGTTENSKDLQAHMVFSAEALTGFITPN